MIERIVWIIFDTILAIFLFIRGGAENLTMGICSCICVVYWIIDCIFWYKKEKRKQKRDSN